ncbi:MAG: ABC transporter permease [Bryobacteraceae bacterium]
MRWWRRKAREEDLEREIQSHLSAEAGEQIEHGLAEAEAHYAAQRALGNATLVKEDTRAIWGWTSLERVGQDLRYALRTMRKNPAFTAVALISLALGIGANTAIFTLIYTLLLKSLPVKNPRQLYLVARTMTNGIGRSYSYPGYRLMRDRNHTLDGLIAFNGAQPGVVAGSGTEVEYAARQFVSGNFFAVLGVSPILGRALTDDDDRVPGAHPVAVISFGFWQRKFGMAPSVIGRSITVDETPYTIVGVAPRGFSGVERGTFADLWIPAMMMDRACVTSPGCQTFRLLARLHPGIPAQKASADLDVAFAQHLAQRAVAIRNDYVRRTFLNQHIKLADGSIGFSPLGYAYAKPLYLLMAVVGIILLIACANVANLLLARAAARGREVAVRLAVGAGRRRLIRQFLTESLLLASFASGLGLILAFWISAGLVKLLPQLNGATTLDVHPDATVLAFTSAIALLSTLLFGLAPAVRSTKTDLTSALKDSSYFQNLPGGRPGLGKSLIVMQVALSMLLLVGAGLFWRTLANLRTLDVGFNRDHVLLFDAAYPRKWKPEQIAAANQRLLERLRSLSGVIAAGTAAPNPLSGSTWDDDIKAEGYTAHPDENLDVNFMSVSPGALEALHTPLLRGRLFDERDRKDSPKVVLVNQTLARYFCARANPIGRHLEIPNAGKAEIVGVLRDSKFVSLREETPRMVYIPASQAAVHPAESFVARTAGEPAAFVGVIRELARDAEPNARVTSVRTMADQMDETLVQERLIAKLSGVFGLLALLLAAVGLYGVMAYAVGRRTNEIGIRRARGARRSDVLMLVLGETLLLIFLGLMAGIPIALACGHWVAALLFGLSPTDSTTILAAATLLAATAIAAGAIPAYRAAKVDPMIALRYE